MSEAIAVAGHNSLNIADLVIEHVNELHDDAAKLRQRADDLNGGADRCEVTDDDTAAKATDLVKMIQALLKKTEDQRTDAKKPFLDAGKKIDGIYNPIKTVAESAKRAVEAKLSAYVKQKRDAEEAERRRLAEEARKTAEAAQQAQSAAAAQELADKAAHLATQAAAPASSTPIRSDLGAAASTRKVLRHEIVDQALLPAEYWMPDLGLIAAKVKSSQPPAGAKEWQPIPGVRAWYDEQVVVR
jgi:hypothetical protein